MIDPFQLARPRRRHWMRIPPASRVSQCEAGDAGLGTRSKAVFEPGSERASAGLSELFCAGPAEQCILLTRVTDCPVVFATHVARLRDWFAARTHVWTGERFARNTGEVVGGMTPGTTPDAGEGRNSDM
jgi:hypothetical protein